MRARRRAGVTRGFTLIEVLVAVGIFALIGVVAAALLTRTLEARELGATRAERLQGLQRAVMRLERDLMQRSVREIRDAFGDPIPAMRLDDSGALELTTQGWRNPLGLARSELQRVRWTLDEEGTLQRSFWSVLDRAQDSTANEQGVLEALDAFVIEVVDAQGGTHSTWPADGAGTEAAALPGAPDADPAGESADGAGGGEDDHAVAIRFAIELAPYGRVERLIELPEAVTLQEEALAPGGGDSDAATDDGDVQAGVDADDA